MSTEEKKDNTYCFNFILDTPDSFSEEEQKGISETLKKEFKTRLLNMGYHPSSYRLENEWYKRENVSI